jgi:hypothetical protein
LLCIFPAHQGHAGIDVQRKALADGCDGIRFFVCGEHDSAFADKDGFVVLAMQGQTESHRNIWEKIWRMWSWVGEHENLAEYDWVVKLDLDTLFSPWNFRRMLHTEASMQRADFIGHVVSHYGTDEAPLGAAYALRSEALRRALPVLATLKPGANTSLVQSSKHANAQHCSPERTVAEEVKLAHCLGIVGINVVGAVDADGREFFQPFQLCAHRFRMPPPEAEDTEKDWFWRDKPLNASLADCCAAYPVAFHAYSVPELERYYPVFTGRSRHGSNDGSEATMNELLAAHTLSDAEGHCADQSK